MALDAREAHHVRDVLRLAERTPVEVFDDQGNVGIGVLRTVNFAVVTVLVESVSREIAAFRFAIASAVPKAARGDWMVEKLTELGADVFIPLAAARSVVLPEGKNKLERWQRLALEAAKQSHRRGVMRIEPLTALPAAIEHALASGEAWHLSTSGATTPLRDLRPTAQMLTLFIGPEGGWSDEEVELFERYGIPAISLTSTILRIETAAIGVAAVVGTLFATDSSLFNSPSVP